MTEQDERILNEIQSLLAEIPDAYDDFIRYAPSQAYGQGFASELLDYLKGSDGLTSSDVIEWIIDRAGWD